MIDFFFAMVGSSPIEWIAVICGLANVGLIIRRSIWNYPFGFVMVVLYFFIFWEYKLYADAFLQIYFFGIQIYGLCIWWQGRANDGRVRVAPLSSRDFLIYLLIVAIAWITIGWLMGRYTNAAAPMWDAAVAALSVMAQFLLSRRHMQSWYLWISVDILAIGLFYSRGLPATSALYVVFLVLAVLGLRQWRNAALQA